MNPAFLTLDEMLASGGAIAAEDISPMRFAIEAVEAQTNGVYLHATLAEIAAAYFFYICRSGNKRAGISCALAFLALNGKKITARPDDLYNLVIGVADGKITKAAVAVFFEKHA